MHHNFLKIRNMVKKLKEIKIVLTFLCCVELISRCEALTVKECSSFLVDSSNYSTVFRRSGGCFLVTETNYTKIYTIQLRNESSLIYLKVYPTVESGIVASNMNLTITELDQSAVIRKFQENESFTVQRYISRSSFFSIHLSCDSNWTNTIFTYEELAFESWETASYEDKGSLQPSMLEGKFYRPNTLLLYHLVPAPKIWNESSVMITLWTFDVDEIAGDYLLIGSGTEPFLGPPSAFITGKIETPKKYYVAADNAFILFFAQASNEQKIGFNLTWERSGNRITEPEDESTKISIPDSVLQAIPICFYNSSWIQEFNDTDVDKTAEPFPQFRQKFADIANRYVKTKKIPFISEIKSKTVKIFRVSSVILPVDDDPVLNGGVIYAMVTIVQPYDSERAVFRWTQLEEILDQFDEYDAKNNHVLLGTKVGKCPADINFTTWYAATGISFVACTILFLVLWTWRYNAFWRSLKLKSPNKASISHFPIISDNADEKSTIKSESVSYKSTGLIKPRLRLTNENGRSYSLDDEKDGIDNPCMTVLSEEENESDEEVYNRNWVLKPRKYGRSFTAPGENNDGTSNSKTYTAPLPRKTQGKSGLLWRENQMGEFTNAIGFATTEHAYHSVNSNCRIEFLDSETRL